MAGIRQYVLSAMPSGFRRQLRLLRLLRRMRRQRARVRPQPHGLPGELIISLTSYPPRFDYLHLTLESLLNQTVAADRVILWIADKDMKQLTAPILRLRKRGLDIRPAPDLRSFKKLVFAIEQFPDAYIVTADDDVFYPSDWLAPLVADCRPGVITCHRAHRIPGFDRHEPPPPYRDWEWDVDDDRARRPCADIVATGVGGVLYPPQSLDPEVVDASIFMALCPRADDLWFYMMARRAGSLYQKVGGEFEQMSWPDSQGVALYNDNLMENDRQMANLLARYGHPAQVGPSRPDAKSTAG